MRLTKLARTIDHLGRRQFLSQVARTALGVSALPFLGGLSANDSGSTPFVRPRASRVINLFMEGGMCHFDSFDPKPRVPGASKAIKTSADMQFSEWVPELSKLAHEMTVVRSLTSNQGAHPEGRYFMRTGYTVTGTTRHPFLGSWADVLRGKRNQTLPGSVVIGGGSAHPGRGFLDSKHAPLALGGAEDGLPHSAPYHRISEQRNDLRHQLLQGLEQNHAKQFQYDSAAAYRDLYHEAVALMDSSDLAAFDVTKENDQVLAEYDKTPFGLGCVLARRLVESDVRYVEVTMGGWDSHVEHVDEMTGLMPQFDQTCSALIRDLKRRGLLDSTIVMITTEFGRTPDLNRNNGRNHHPSVFSSVLAGGPFKRGYVHGSSDDRAGLVDRDKMQIPDLHATVAHAVGLPTEHIIYNSDGRPFTVGDKGRVVSDLMT